MLADDVAASERGKADIATAPLTGMSVAAAHAATLEIDATTVCCRLAEHQGGGGEAFHAALLADGGFNATA